MEGTWPVCLGEKKVGQCVVTRQGLYYQICCRCVVPGEPLLRLCWNGQELGLLAPEGGQLRLDTRRPCKHFPQGTPSFTLEENRRRPEELFIPLSPGEPFAYLSRLEGARLSYQNGKKGITLSDKT